MTERGALTEHAAPERLVVARGLFSGPSAQVSDEMYARIMSGKAHRERNALHLEHGATVDTNTYFGRLPASYFQRWTIATEVQLKLVFDASGPATLLLRASDAGGTERRGRDGERDARAAPVQLLGVDDALETLGVVLQRLEPAGAGQVPLIRLPDDFPRDAFLAVVLGRGGAHYFPRELTAVVPPLLRLIAQAKVHLKGLRRGWPPHSDLLPTRVAAVD